MQTVDVLIDPVSFNGVADSLRNIAELANYPPVAIPAALPDPAKQLYEDLGAHIHSSFIEFAECLTACVNRLDEVVAAYR